MKSAWRLPASLSPRGEAVPIARLEVDLPSLPQPISLFQIPPDEILSRALRGEEDAYCAEVWPSAYAASEALISHLSRGGCRGVIEMGCGPGLPSLTALAAGAVSVRATDWSPLALSLTQHAANTFQPTRAPQLRVELHDIHADYSLPSSAGHLIVAADLLYDQETAHSLGRQVGKHISRGGHAIIADPGRPGGREAFWRGVAFSRTASGPLRNFVECALPSRWAGTSGKATIGVCML